MAKNGHTDTETKKATGNIPEEAPRFVLNYFNQNRDARLVYHNFPFSVEVARRAGEIANENAYSTDVEKRATLAAWFFHLGWLADYSNPIPKSIEIFREFAAETGLSSEKTKNIVSVISTIGNKEKLTSKAAHCLADAINSCHFGRNFFERSPLFRLEKELMSGQQLSKTDWAQLQSQQLLNARFFTPFGKVTFEPIIAQNLLTQKQSVEKTKNDPRRKEGEEVRKFQDLERKLPNSATQTFFRTNYRNHINLSAIADGKANIMITVNALLISALITIITYKNITETTPIILLPTVIFLVTGLTSLIFAVLSARPKVTSLNKEAPSFEQAKKNIVFFGNFVTLDLEKYEEAMDAMFRDGELLYGNMTRDLYHLGKVLDKKYRFLTISYNIFMVGFVATVVTFLISLFA